MQWWWVLMFSSFLVLNYEYQLAAAYRKIISFVNWIFFFFVSLLETGKQQIQLIIIHGRFCKVTTKMKLMNTSLNYCSVSLWSHFHQPTIYKLVWSAFLFCWFTNTGLLVSNAITSCLNKVYLTLVFSP